mgnify:CR=1 FL=1
MKRQFSIYGALAAFTLFWGMLTGCEADDTPGGSSSGEVVPVTISLQMDEVDQLTKAVNESAINTLDVYIVQGNQTIHLTESDFDNTSWESTSTVELVDGQTYQIYAIANADDNNNPYGETAPDNTDVNAFEWLNVQSDAYMPMSTTKDTTWKVSSTQPEYEVRLNRMVAKMNVKIVDERNTKTDITSVTISDLMVGTTNLYREGYGKVSLPTDVATSDWKWDDLTFSSSEANSGDFYLHENSGTFPVSVKVGNDTRKGSFTKTIPRNHIFPLVIHLTDYSLDIDVEYQLAAIGTLPVTKKLNTYSFELPEGCTYKVTVKPDKKTSEDWATDANWTWTVPANFGTGNLKVNPINGVAPSWPNNAVIDGTDDAVSFSGSVVSVPTVEEYKIPIVLNDGEVTMNFDLVIKTRPLGDGEYTKSYSVSAETEAVHIDL